ncbi:MAG: acyl-CoA dehydrogenase family protein [Saprospiraceae bacterium]|nr:acyl-CoA dehydrogenase family protein [Saprospiraceae bacterium]
MEQTIEKSWMKLIHSLSEDFSQRATEHDWNDVFVTANYMTLKQNDFFSAMIPLELGGAGISHAEMCDLIRVMAQACGSTALAFSMHQHLLAANIWKYKKGKGGEETLLKVAKTIWY